MKHSKTLKTLILSLTALFLLASFTGCGGGETKNPDNGQTGTPKTDPRYDGATVTAKITMQDGGVIVIELDHASAPITVENFVSLAESGFYDNLTFHRAAPGFVIQGGDPSGNGTGSPGYRIKGEFTANGVNNPILHERGVISMARSSDYNSAGCQFFIVTQTNVNVSKSLDGKYAAFGKVIEGLDVVDRIEAMETDDSELILNKPVIQSIEIVFDKP